MTGSPVCAVQKLPVNKHTATIKARARKAMLELAHQNTRGVLRRKYSEVQKLSFDYRDVCNVVFTTALQQQINCGSEAQGLLGKGKRHAVYRSKH